MTTQVGPPAAEYTAVDPILDSRGFRRALGQFSTGVAVVTIRSNGSPMGMTINSFSSVSLDPPLVLWALRKDSGRARAFLGADHFVVNILASSQMEVSQTFASSTSGTDAFDQVDWWKDEHGCPLLQGSLTHLECDIWSVLDGGDHHVVLGSVRRAAITDGEPLIYAQGSYAVPARFLGDHSDRASDQSATSAQESWADAESFTTLLTDASHHNSLRFDETRARYGLTVATNRILKRVSEQPLTAAQLVATTHLGERAVEDGLAELVEDGSIRREGATYGITPAGSARRQKVAKQVQAFMDAALSDFDPGDIDTAMHVLRAVAAS